MKKYVAYIRVSTNKQERSGLSFEAQRAVIEHNATSDKAEIVKEYIETESGKDIENRPQLKEAIKYCLTNDSILLVAKLDRLSRDIEHIFKIKKQLGDKFKSCDLPDTDTVTLGIYAIFAQKEREIIGIRTKVALQAKKQRGQKLGKVENFTQAGRIAGGKARREQAQKNPRNQRAVAMAKAYRKEGYTMEAIAQQLNMNGFKTPLGKDFVKGGVSRILKKVTMK
jgi:DNA invertase Pin-like site-specific DNA recombinase